MSSCVATLGGERRRDQTRYPQGEEAARPSEQGTGVCAGELGAVEGVHACIHTYTCQHKIPKCFLLTAFFPATNLIVEIRPLNYLGSPFINKFIVEIQW